MYSRHRTWLILRLVGAVALVLATAAACPWSKPVANVADDAGRAWVNKVKPGLGPVPGALEFGDDAGRATKIQTADNWFSETPTTQQRAQMSPDVRAELEAALAKLTAERQYYQQLDSVFGTMTQRRAGMRTIATTVVDRSAVRPLNQRAKDYVSEQTEAILHEVMCEVAWDAMLSPERDAVNAELQSDRFDISYDVAWEAAVRSAAQTFVNAIAGAGRTAFLKQFIEPEIIDWGFYGKDVLDKATELTSDRQMTVTSPEGVRVTYAFLQFARVCLKPPGT